MLKSQPRCREGISLCYQFRLVGDEWYSLAEAAAIAHLTGIERISTRSDEWRNIYRRCTFFESEKIGDAVEEVYWEMWSERMELMGFEVAI